MWLAGRAGDTRQPCPVLSHERCSTHDRATETASVSCRECCRALFDVMFLNRYGGDGATADTRMDQHSSQLVTNSQLFFNDVRECHRSFLRLRILLASSI